MVSDEGGQYPPGLLLIFGIPVLFSPFSGWSQGMVLTCSSSLVLGSGEAHEESKNPNPKAPSASNFPSLVPMIKEN